MSEIVPGTREVVVDLPAKEGPYPPPPKSTRFGFLPHLFGRNNGIPKEELIVLPRSNRTNIE